MSRIDELYDLQREIEKNADTAAPRLEGTVARAEARLRKRAKFRRRILRPLVGVAATFVIFVLAVNFSVPVAYACSKVPILRELAEAVTFSRSLTDAVNNEYVQPLYLEQENGGVTATVEYLIVDQKQVNVFFRLDSETYEALAADPQVLEADGERFASCSYGLNAWNVKNGELQSLTIDFVDEDVPDSLRMKLQVMDMSYAPDGVMEEPAPAYESVEDAILADDVYEEPEYVANFDFLLEFDPEFTAAGKVIPVNETVEMNGQKIMITDMEIYPTHLRVDVESDPENTAWMTHLDFYIETDWGMKFDTISNGISATGKADSHEMSSYRADSTYFYEAKHLKIVFTGVEWLTKDMEKVYVNLETGETEKLPEGVTFKAATKRDGGWVVEFQGQCRRANHMHQLFRMSYYDAAGTEYYMNSWDNVFGEENADGEMFDFVERFPLKDYHESEVWLEPKYSYYWTPEEKIEVIVQ